MGCQKSDQFIVAMKHAKAGRAKGWQSVAPEGETLAAQEVDNEWRTNRKG